jgi:hypothetical protein
MPALRDSDLDDVLSSIASWRPFDPGGACGLFVGAIGFEERASACFIDWCAARKGRGGKAFLVEYPMNQADNAAQESRLLLAADAAGIRVIRRNYTRLALFGQAQAFFAEEARDASILLDLSGMASFVFYPLISAICDSAPGATLDVCYAEAARYFPGRSEWVEFTDKFKALDLVDRARLFEQYCFQSKGVESVFESPHFPGRNDTQPTSLVVVPNFSVERVHRMLSFAADNYSVNREECEWIIGMPPDRGKNGWRCEALWELFQQPPQKHDACTLDFKEILVALQRIWRDLYVSRSLVIATVGSKAQHLGTFLFLKMHPDVGLVLSEPKQFTASTYSKGVGRKWRVSFGPVGALLKVLRDWHQIIFSW